MNDNVLYVNRPQHLVQTVKPFECYLEWSRGTGKSSGAIAPRTEDLVFQMPRGHFFYVANTYQALMTKTLPEVIKALEMRGYHRDRDYFIGQCAPKAWKWELPFAPPLRYDYFMHWRNGSGISFVSQDRAGMVAGISFDGGIGDEAKHLNAQRLDEELLPTNRGNLGAWAGSHRDKRINDSLHHSLMFCSDTPTSQSGRWFTDMDKEHDEQKVQEIYAIELEIVKLSQKAKTAQNAGTQANILSRINTLTQIARRIRKGDPEKYARTGDRKYKPCVMFSQANVWDNIHVLGLNYVDQQKRKLPDIIFRSSILNERINQVSEGFYPDLSDAIHGYDSFSSSYFEQRGYDFDKYKELDCRQDNDVDPNKPLDMGQDYGGNFNCLVVGQHHGTEYRLVNAMHVQKGEKIKDLVAQFKKYYRFHKRKEVNFFYDHTAKRTDAINDTEYHLEYMNELRKADEYGAWKVNDRYMGRTPSPALRFEFWGKLLNEQQPHWPRFRYNRNHCEYWAISCMMAPMKVGSSGFEKDKKSERQKNADGEFVTPQEEATHFSDAGDTLLYFRINSTHRHSSGPSMGAIVPGR